MSLKTILMRLLRPYLFFILFWHWNSTQYITSFWIDDLPDFEVKINTNWFFHFYDRIDELLDEIRDAESLVYTYRKEMRDLETQLKQQQNLYSAVRNDRTGM